MWPAPAGRMASGAGQRGGQRGGTHGDDQGDAHLMRIDAPSPDHSDDENLPSRTLDFGPDTENLPPPHGPHSLEIFSPRKSLAYEYALRDAEARFEDTRRLAADKASR